MQWSATWHISLKIQKKYSLPYPLKVVLDIIPIQRGRHPTPIKRGETALISVEWGPLKLIWMLHRGWKLKLLLGKQYQCPPQLPPRPTEVYNSITLKKNVFFLSSYQKSIFLRFCRLWKIEFPVLPKSGHAPLPEVLTMEICKLYEKIH